MKRFNFTLRPLGIIRAHRERRARMALGTALRKVMEAENILGQARARTDALARSMASGRSGRYSAASEAAAYRAYLNECAVEAEQEKRLNAARAEADRCRNDCVEANRQVKIVERLEQAALTRYVASVYRSEQAEFDEIAGHRAARRSPHS
jgi:flagellar export protein FliJ